MNKYKNNFIGATGDPDQLSPNGETVNNVDYDDYRKNILNSMFKNEIFLNQNKRCKTKKEKVKVASIMKRIKKCKNQYDAMELIKKKNWINIIEFAEDIKTENAICLSNFACDTVNKIIREGNMKPTVEDV